MNKKSGLFWVSYFKMQSTGLEPEPTNVDMNLNHARMPIPPRLRKHKKKFYLLLQIEQCGKRDLNPHENSFT